MRQPRIVVTVGPDGVVGAETLDVLGDRCLDYIALLEDLVGALTVDSAYTEDHSRAEVTARRVDHDVERA